jgi:hypothetical protein
MEPLLHASFFALLFCLGALFYLLYRKNSLWKKFAVGLAVCLALLLAAAFLGRLLPQLKPPQAAPLYPAAELLKYEVQSLNAPTEAQVKGWRRGVLCSLSYVIGIEKNDPSEAEFARIVEDVMEKDAKIRRNWNFIYFYLKTPAGRQSGIPYLSGIYSLPGGAEQSNKVRPGEYTDKYRFILLRR